jgi:hypothetical protein
VLAGDRGERPADAHASGQRVLDLAAELRDEGREVAELRDPAEAHERGDDVVRERLVDHLEGEVPAVVPQVGAQRLQRRGHLEG